MSHSPLDDYLVLSVFTQESFFQSLSNLYCSPKVVSQQRPAQYVFSYLTELKAQTLVVEQTYVDGDYLDDYSSYYARCFQSYNRFCRRLHFFSAVYEHFQFVEILTGEPVEIVLQDFSKHYLGFVVARPLPTSVVGRTILKTYSSDQGRRFYPCVKTYRPNVFGMTLEIQGLAFQQQDSVLAACATVALWSCYHKTAELFGTPCPRPAAITSVANQVVGSARPFPSGGLRIEQICNSIRKLDLEPEVFHVTQHVRLVSLLYSYMKMGIPVLLVVDVQGVGLHALTLVGYSLTQKSMPPDQGSLHLLGTKIDKFYAHDDQNGPYSRLFVKPPLDQANYPAPVSFEGSWQSLADNSLLPLIPKAVIVPVYNKIRLKFSDVLQPLERLNFILGLSEEKWDSGEWDVHLVTTKELKEEIRAQQQHPRLKSILLAPHPRFIWRAILTLQEIMVLELLADATDVKLNCPFYQCTVFDSTLKSFLQMVLDEKSVRPSVLARLTAQLTEPFFQFLKNAVSEQDPSPEP